MIFNGQDLKIEDLLISRRIKCVDDDSSMDADDASEMIKRKLIVNHKFVPFAMNKCYLRLLRNRMYKENIFCEFLFVNCERAFLGFCVLRL